MKMIIVILTASVMVISCFWVLNCRASKSNNTLNREARFEIAKLIYDNENNLLIIQNNESARIVTQIQLDRNNDTLKLEIKSENIGWRLNRRTAVISAIKLSPDMKFVEVKGVVFPLSELRSAESIRKISPNSLDPTIIFKPKHFPFTGEIKCS